VDPSKPLVVITDPGTGIVVVIDPSNPDKPTVIGTIDSSKPPVVITDPGTGIVVIIDPINPGKPIVINLTDPDPNISPAILGMLNPADFKKLKQKDLINICKMKLRHHPNDAYCSEVLGSQKQKGL
jgi:hypothetical protein